jgi:hypothetical protein
VNIKRLAGANAVHEDYAIVPGLLLGFMSLLRMRKYSWQLNIAVSLDPNVIRPKTVILLPLRLCEHSDSAVMHGSCKRVLGDPWSAFSFPAVRA